MTYLSPTNLCITIAAARERPTWAAIMASIGAGEALAYKWLRMSKKDQEARTQAESKFYVTFEADGADYWHEHLKRSKAAFMSGFERKILDACANNLTETCFDPSTGRPLQMLNANYLYRTAEWFAENEEWPGQLKYEWERDLITDEILQPLRPIWQTKIVQSSAQIKIRALASHLSQWSEKIESTHTVQGHVVHHMAVPKFVPKAVREQTGDVVDADFTEVREQLPGPDARRDITELRAQAERILNDPNRVTKPTGTVRMGDGTPLNDRRAGAEKPDHEDELPPAPRSVAADKPRPKEATQAQPARPPSYARRETNNPYDANARAAPAGSKRSITR
jgi:hypothetical protein